MVIIITLDDQLAEIRDRFGEREGAGFAAGALP
ncbi:hypothetical protein BBM1114_10485 [Bifidobacterium breve MCC 1114]|jgi:hypothetical protein|uniref:Uncharacterized protein n=1 Tax=Bifidobacterium breve MCC 1114 TaxID=1365964 RepID=A0A0L7CSQ7_BIFBR|nr:hypothetical protein BBM1114_10485 [Bifidobacterium breve MCC 1114]